MKIKKGIDWSKKDIYEGIGRPDLKPKVEKINLAKRLAPYTIKKLETEGKAQIKAALKNVGLEDIDMLNKCSDCELRRLVINIKTQKIHSYCPVCPKETISLEEYLDDEEEARELQGYDDYDTSMECHLRQIGERQL